MGVQARSGGKVDTNWDCGGLTPQSAMQLDVSPVTGIADPGYNKQNGVKPPYSKDRLSSPNQERRKFGTALAFFVMDDFVTVFDQMAGTLVIPARWFHAPAPSIISGL